MNILGIDNIFFEVRDLEIAIAFYTKLGLELKFKKGNVLALCNIGNEEPGLILFQTNNPKSAKIWVEVPDASQAKTECEQHNITGTMKEVATGFTFEVTDVDGNIIGFADYKKRPELARK